MFISPNVTIYKFPITAITSIANRLSGLILSGYFVGGGIYAGMGKDPFRAARESEHKKLLYFSAVSPLVYHTLGGFRHFLWDRYPEFLLTNRRVMVSSWGLLLSTGMISWVSEKYVM